MWTSTLLRWTRATSCFIIWGCLAALQPPAAASVRTPFVYKGWHPGVTSETRTHGNSGGPSPNPQHMHHACIIVGAQTCGLVLCTAVQWTSNVRRLLGPASVSTIYGADHVALRKLLNPAFTHKASMQFLPGLVVIMQAHLRDWAAAGRIKAVPCIKSMAFTVRRSRLCKRVSGRQSCGACTCVGVLCLLVWGGDEPGDG